MFKHSAFEFLGADTGSDHLPTDFQVGVFAPAGEVFVVSGHVQVGGCELHESFARMGSQKRSWRLERILGTADLGTADIWGSPRGLESHVVGVVEVGVEDGVQREGRSEKRMSKTGKGGSSH